MQIEHSPTPFDDGAFYDLMLGKFTPGLDYYLELAKAAKGPVLDVGCGTGRILLPCLKAGIDAEGLDLFEGMLKQLRAKATALGLNPTLHQADMAKFSLPRRYALIVIPFNAFVHNLTTDDQLACLGNCSEHLLQEGLLTFDVSFPGQHWVGQSSGARAFEGEMPHPETGLPMKMWDTRTFDRVKQVQYSFNEVELLDAAGNVVETRRSKTTMRWTYKTEMELLMRVAGFSRWEILGGFDGRPLLQETDDLIVKAWKAETAV